MLQALLLSTTLVVSQIHGPPPQTVPSRTSNVTGQQQQAGPSVQQAQAVQKQTPPGKIAPGQAPPQGEVPFLERYLPQAEVPKSEAETSTAIEQAEAAERWWLMKHLQGSWLGVGLTDNRMSISGWTEMSYTGSTTAITNQPVVWNDRANRFLLQQAWLRLERSVVTSGTAEPTFGYRIDILGGSDYRFTLPRGLFNSQLLNANGTQNLYGVDPIQFYVNGYFPGLFQGTEVRIGRLYTPFGSESLEAVSTPLMSRSYAFNWSPPFTHMGIGLYPTFNDQWSGVFMLANGNDVFIDPAQEARFVGAITYSAPNQRDAITFGTSIGRGKFNAGQPFNPATVGLMTEPAGRSNINVFDLVWTHIFSERFIYGFETIYGYQYAVPANVPGGIIDNQATTGTAHWGSIVNYFTYNYTKRLSSILRVEFFDDFEGQRTGFEGLYSAVTFGVQYRPRPGVIFRPEVRYDHNHESTPFEGHHGILTAGADLIFRW